MTYLAFHLAFLLPPIALLLFLRRRDGGPAAGRLDPDGRRAGPALGVVMALALAYTTPWDNHLVARGVWGYPPERVLATIGYVPVEEYAFFVLQPILTGLVLFTLARRAPGPTAVSPRARTVARFVGTTLFLTLALGGLLLLRADATTYLGLILAWAAPVATLHWAVGGGALMAHGRLVALAVAVPTAYLWLADRIALAAGIWQLSPRFTTGAHLLGLPVEEALFFLITNLLVVQGLLLFLVLLRDDDRAPVGRSRWTS